MLYLNSWPYGYPSILNSVDMTPLFYSQFNAEFNDLFEVNNSYIVSVNRFQVFTDGSMQRHGVCAGICISQLGVNICFKLSDKCSIIQPK